MHLCPDEINILGHVVNFVSHCWCFVCVYAGKVLRR
jgi:hypothetical protein